MCAFTYLDGSMATTKITATTKTTTMATSTSRSNNNRKSNPSRMDTKWWIKKQFAKHTLHIKMESFLWIWINYIFRWSCCFLSFKFNCAIIEYKLKQPNFMNIYIHVSVDIIAVLFSCLQVDSSHGICSNISYIISIFSFFLSSSWLPYTHDAWIR